MKKRGEATKGLPGAVKSKKQIQPKEELLYNLKIGQI